MKKIALTIFLLGILVSSCSSKKKRIKNVTQKVTTINSIEKILYAYMEAWAAHDISKIESFYANDVQWYDLPSDGKTVGKEKVGKAITDAFMGYVPDMYWVKSGDSFISGNTITYEWMYGGTFNGTWGEKTITNKKFSIKGISTTTINDKGEIIAQKDYYDLYGFQKQLGIID